MGHPLYGDNIPGFETGDIECSCSGRYDCNCNRCFYCSNDRGNCECWRHEDIGVDEIKGLLDADYSRFSILRIDISSLHPYSFYLKMDKDDRDEYVLFFDDGKFTLANFDMPWNDERFKQRRFEEILKTSTSVANTNNFTILEIIFDENRFKMIGYGDVLSDTLETFYLSVRFDPDRYDEPSVSLKEYNFR